MKWEKIAVISELPKKASWMHSHLANPIALPSHVDNQVRFFCNVRDVKNRSHIIEFMFDMVNFQVQEVNCEPILKLGEQGSFDDSGTSIGCMIKHNDSWYLYYLGWNLANNVPFRNSIGLAIERNGKFSKISEGPILDRSTIDPITLSYPYILKINNKFKMWYGSHKYWGGKGPNDMNHCIKYAESEDGIEWSRKGTICLDTDSNDYAFSRPCVIFENDIYKMWYSHRGTNYRIGYATSFDGVTWSRKDHEVGIDVTNSSFDSEMIEYPFIFDHQGERYMIYNGNDYGKTGLGIAVLVEE